MKKFLTKLIFLLLSIITINLLLMWIINIPQRILIDNNIEHIQKKWNNLKSKKYDVMIFGSSRSYNAYNPLIIDTITSKVTYNMGTSFQHITESYFSIKEVLKDQKPEIIILDINSFAFQEKPEFIYFFEHQKYVSSEISKEMSQIFLKEKFLQNFVPIYVNRKRINFEEINRSYNFTTQYFKNKKNTINNLKQDWNNSGWQYKDSTSYHKAKYIPLPNHDYEKISSTTFSYIHKIKKICEENNIKFICIRTAYPSSRLKMTDKDYEFNYFNSKLNSMGIPFYDFNYKSQFTYFENDFHDGVHLSFLGAQKASIDLANVINENLLIDKEKLP